MSKRHQATWEERKPARDERLAERRKERKQAKLSLALDGEDHLLTVRPGHLHSHRTSKPEEDGGRRKRRHWKLPFWKRRVNDRKAKAEAWEAVGKEGLTYES